VYDPSDQRHKDILGLKDVLRCEINAQKTLLGVHYSSVTIVDLACEHLEVENFKL
jgi:hypothetical protein